MCLNEWKCGHKVYIHTRKNVFNFVFITLPFLLTIKEKLNYDSELHSFITCIKETNVNHKFKNSFQKYKMIINVTLHCMTLTIYSLCWFVNNVSTNQQKIKCKDILILLNKSPSSEVACQNRFKRKNRISRNEIK